MACCLTAPNHYLTKVDLSTLRSSDIHLRAISSEITKPSVTKISFKMTCRKFYSYCRGPVSETYHDSRRHNRWHAVHCSVAVPLHPPTSSPWQPLSWAVFSGRLGSTSPCWEASGSPDMNYYQGTLGDWQLSAYCSSPHGSSRCELPWHQWDATGKKDITVAMIRKNSVVNVKNKIENKTISSILYPPIGL